MAMSLFDVRPLASTLEGVGRVHQVEVSIKETPAEVTVRVVGEASLGQVDQLTAALLCLSARRPKLVNLDLSGLSFVSSLAMGVLVAFRRGVVRAGGQVRLADSLQESVREALVRAELLALFDRPAGAEGRQAAPPVVTGIHFPLTRKEEVQP
jgi:anti-anti-sigma factor